MTKLELVKKLREHGYTVEWKPFRYWDNIPHVVTSKYIFAVAETKFQNNNQYIITEFPFDDVINAIEFFNNSPEFHEILQKLDMSLYYAERTD